MEQTYCFSNVFCFHVIPSLTTELCLAFIIRNLSKQLKIYTIKIVIVGFIKSNKNSLFYQH
jgi:hypothetical protein